MAIRRPAVAGSFYPAEKRELEGLIRASYLHPLGPGRLPPAPKTSEGAVACVVPHAGYMYSGPVAAHSFLHISSLAHPDLFVIVAPNHYGIGSGVSSYRGGEWETPLGRMKVERAAAEELARITEILDFDPASHQLEHSLEVQLPFLQMIYGDSIPFVPISLSFQDLGTTRTLAEGVAKLVKGRRAALIASSDLTHYEPAEVARTKDMALIKEMEKMDVEAFYSRLQQLEITACGFGAISTVMQAAKLLGFKKGELLKYASSGDTTGDNNQVVGYCSLRFV
jgi:AmmeMemoRadiSam system protein B